MSQTTENIALLYLMNQDTKDLSLMELIELYLDTLEKTKECAKQFDMEHNGSVFRFD